MLNIQRSANGQHDIEQDRRLRVPQHHNGQRKLDQLCRSLPVQLRSHFPVKYMSLVLMKQAGRTWYVLDDQDPSTLSHTQLAPIEEPLLSWVIEHQEALIIPNVEEETGSSSWRSALPDCDLKSVCALPLMTTHGPVGAMLIGSAKSNIYSKECAQHFSQIADQIALSIDNSLIHAELKEYQAVLKISTSLVSFGPEDLSRGLAAILNPLIQFDFLDVIVFKEGSSEVLWHSIGAGQLPQPDVPVEETTCWWVHEQQQPLYIADWKRDERFAVRREALKKQGFEYRSLCRVPLRTLHGRLGVFSVASSRPHEYSQEEVRFLTLVADQVALTVSSILGLETSRRSQSELKVKSAQLGLLHDLTKSMTATSELHEVLRTATLSTRRVMQSDFALIALLDSEKGRWCVNAFDFSDNNGLEQEALNSLAGTLGGFVLPEGKPWIGNADDVTALRNCCVLPLVARDQVLGILVLSKREEIAYTLNEVDFLFQVASQLAIAIEKLRDNPDQETISLDNEIPNEPNFREIVGKSAALRRVLHQVSIVAPTDSRVLIQGETGTGKELIAHAIHNLSARRDKPFVKLNCAAIPSGLLESELFGHEKGAFTGAIMRKAGRFEVADKGTLFLDEVGDIPLELQPKLLRVLQEQEFERLGSTRVQRVDVRVVAATHRNLKQMVEDGQFRSDLFYRLHAFPVCVPPLRERTEDIAILVRYFVDKYARQMKRRIETIPSQAMEAFANYSWPGNVRELQTFIERAVILSPGTILTPPLDELNEKSAQQPNSQLSTLEEAERAHFLRAIREANWVIGGPSGAAARLGMKRTTLAYRIRKLNIPCRPE